MSGPFKDPGELADGDLRLVVKELYPGDPTKAWAPAYRFDMIRNGQTVGRIELRLGATDFMVRFGGQVGYEVDPPFRGHHFAARALSLLIPLAREHHLSPLWITCDPTNVASRRSCELAGATFIEVVTLPEDCDMYRRGDRERCRFRLDC